MSRKTTGNDNKKKSRNSTMPPKKTMQLVCAECHLRSDRDGLRDPFSEGWAPLTLSTRSWTLCPSCTQEYIARLDRETALDGLVPRTTGDEKTPTVLQAVLWVPESRMVTLPSKRQIYRVWTLLEEDASNPEKPPVLPINPEHNRNAFLEDPMHDWAIRGGRLRYFSRVAYSSTWILVEFYP